MVFFKHKKTNKEANIMTKVEELIEKFNELSDEEKEQFKGSVGNDGDPDSKQPDDEEVSVDAPAQDDSEDDSQEETNPTQEETPDSESDDSKLAEILGEIKELRVEIEAVKQAQAEKDSKTKPVEDKGDEKRLSDLRKMYLN